MSADMPIGMCFAPGRRKGRQQRDLVADLTRIASEYKATDLVSLLAERELTRMQIHELPVAASTGGLQRHRLDWRDKFIPDSLAEFKDLIMALASRIRSGARVVVHCNGGKGRTGLTVTCMVHVLTGQPIGTCIDLVRQARPGTIRNPLQILYAHFFAEHMAMLPEMHLTDRTP